MTKYESESLRRVVDAVQFLCLRLDALTLTHPPLDVAKWHWFESVFFLDDDDAWMSAVDALARKADELKLSIYADPREMEEYGSANFSTFMGPVLATVTLDPKGRFRCNLLIVGRPE